MKSITNDWIDLKKRVTGLIGFGGEGKSSLARRWIEDLLEDTTKPQPDGIFWWGFYDRPSVDEFFEAALNYLSGGNTELACLYPSSSAIVHLLAGMLHGGRYLFILDGLEGIQHQQGDQFGLLKSNDLSEFLQFFAAPNHNSFCLVTSRVPLLDMMEYTTYQHRDVERLSAADGRELLQILGVKGNDAELDKVVADWDGHALTLSLIGSYIVNQHNGDISRIKEIPAPTAGEPHYQRVHRILMRYGEHLNDEERAFLKIFSAFRIPIDRTAFGEVFREIPQEEPDNPIAINTSITVMGDSAFDAMVKRLVDYRILRYDIRTGRYTIHPLVRSHYYALLTESDSSQATDVHKQLKEYYLDRFHLAVFENMSVNSTLDDPESLIEAVHHTCQSGDYDEAFSIYRVNIDMYVKLGAYETELNILQEFFPDGDTSRDPLVSSKSDKSWILNVFGLCLMSVGRLDQTEPFLVRSNSIDLNITKDWSHASTSCQNLADLYACLGALDRSAEASLHALELSILAKNKRNERDSNAFLAYAEYLRGNLEDARWHFKKAEDLEREVDPTFKYIYSLQGIWNAEYLMRNGDAANALKITIANRLICEIYDWIDNISRIRRILGDLDCNSGRYNSAREHYDEAIKIARKSTYRQVLVEALLARGRWSAKHMKNARDAFNDLEEAMDYATTSGFRILEADIRVALAWAHLAADNKEKAKAEAIYAKQMSKEMGYYWGNIDADEVLTEIEKA